MWSYKTSWHNTIPQINYVASFAVAWVICTLYYLAAPINQSPCGLLPEKKKDSGLLFFFFLPEKNMQTWPSKWMLRLVYDWKCQQFLWFFFLLVILKKFLLNIVQGSLFTITDSTTGFKLCIQHLLVPDLKHGFPICEFQSRLERPSLGPRVEKMSPTKVPSSLLILLR